MNTDWKKFIDATKDRKPNNYVVDAIRILKLEGGAALDIGCGSGVDARYLGGKGFNVTAFDSEPESVRVAQEITSGLSVKVVEERIENFVFDPAGYDLIVAWRSIPFVDRMTAEKVLKNIQEHLHEGGAAILGLFGPDDGWAKDHPEMSFFSVEELKNLLSQMKFIRLFEERAEGAMATGGTKFWHKIDSIFQKIKKSS